MQHVAQSIEETLQNVFGFTQFREGQEQIIRQLLAGNSALAVFPTGSGKSLCYQLPALHMEGVSLVISPLIALMKDQVDFLREHGVAAARLDSSIGLDEIRRIDAELQAGTLKLLYVAPERFSNERFVTKLRRLKIAMMVIDEAHCISEWGHNFRPDYLKLARESRKLQVPRVLALTATATPSVAEDICREFAIQPEAFVHTGFHRPNLVVRVTACRTGEQTDVLVRRLRERPPGATIVYVTLQRTAEAVADALSKAGFRARPYHAGLATEERDAVQDWFMSSPDAVVVATIAFGMGIDKSDIRYVYHYNLPKSLENYSQEIGRAGRDGKESLCELLACGDDVTVLENFTYGDTPEPTNVADLVQQLVANQGDFDVSQYDLSRKYDVRPLVVNTLLTYLELANVIEATAPFYTEYQFEPRTPSKTMLARFDEERAKFLRALFGTAKKGIKWYTIDLAAAAQKLGTPRDRIVKALTYLEEKGDLTLKVAGLRQGYRMKTRPTNIAQLAQSLVDRFAVREQNDIERVEQVLEFAEETDCLVRHLLAHFGEDLGQDCGHCGRCLGEPAAVVPRREQSVRLQRGPLLGLRAIHPKALGSPRQMARFLCGITSPSLTTAKLGKHALFGSQVEAPFHAVLEAAKALDSSRVAEDEPADYGEEEAVSSDEESPFN